MLNYLMHHCTDISPVDMWFGQEEGGMEGMDSAQDMAAKREYHGLKNSALRYLYIKRRYMSMASDLYKCLC